VVTKLKYSWDVWWHFWKAVLRLQKILSAQKCGRRVNRPVWSNTVVRTPASHSGGPASRLEPITGYAATVALWFQLVSAIH